MTVREQKRARGVPYGWPKALIMVVLLCLVGDPAPAGAGDLKDIVKNLWGGDGICLERVGPTCDPHFLASSLGGLESLSTALASNVGFFAFNSTVTGFTFDIERGVPVQTQRSLGPLLGERAITLGARKLNVAFSYTRVKYTRFEGESLDKLSLTFSHIDQNGDGVLTGPETDIIQADLDLEIEQEVFALFATYGLTRAWDVDVVFPVVTTRVRAKAEATLVSTLPLTVHSFGPDSDPSTSTESGEETGIGDIILRSKYNFLRDYGSWPDLAIIGQVKLPTGDEDNLLGTGETNVLGLLVASRTFGPVTPHVNLGYEFSTDSTQSNARYVLGFDAQMLPTLTLAFDVLGRWEHDGDGIGDHLLDFAVGAKWNLFRVLPVSANVLLPLNKDEGLRADVIWTVGIEYTF